MLLFRIRVVLEITGHVPRLHPVHGPLVYGLLSAAYGEGLQRPPLLPAGLIPLAPEQLRVHLSSGDHYAFGFSLFAASPRAAADTIRVLQIGLERIGSGKRRRASSEAPATLDGNFRVTAVDDLFAKAALPLGALPKPLDSKQVTAEVERLQGLRRVTLDFEAPLRCQLPRPLITATRRYMDHDLFLPGVFLRRLPQRLREAGLDSDGAPHDLAYDSAKVHDSHLVWLDIDYGHGRQRGMRLGGVMGRVSFDLPEGYPVHWLVWGQYTQVGESTRFDHGRYRIVELGPDPYVCRRSASLLSLALRSPALDLAVEESGADPATVIEAARALRAGQYTPPRPRLVWLEQPGHKARRLTISSPSDRALQRAVLTQLAPALDSLFESSSFAYRRGLSRQSAARRVQRLYEQGYRWALQADFDAFFESVAHAELSDRIRAYVGDRELEAVLMHWIEAGDVERDGCGLPTGFPISPLLANLLLDHFDERIAERGGALVRYADDFLILFRDRAQADAIYQLAVQAAEQLRLHLDADKTFLRELNKPFDFLGFRFEPHERWRVSNGRPPCRVEEMGWTDLSRQRSAHAPRVALPGEAPWLRSLHGPVFVADSNIRWIGVEDQHLSLLGASGYSRGPRLDRIEQLLVIGPAALDGSLIAALAKVQVSVAVCDASGQPIWDWFPDDGEGQAQVLQAQVRAAGDPAVCLPLSRQLIAAKLCNYAALDEAYPPRDAASPAPALRELATRAEQAQSAAELLGYEGAGAALWYKTFGARLPANFVFEGRVAPRASDPINVLLNIAQTHLYRCARLAARLVGLSPALGVLHQPRAGFAPLAADLQEPFRMLMDRAVIEAAFHLRQESFEVDRSGELDMRMSFAARRRLLALVYESLHTPVVAQGASEPATYQQHLVRLARNLRRALADRDHTDLRVFRLTQRGVPATSLVEAKPTNGGSGLSIFPDPVVQPGGHA